MLRSTAIFLLILAFAASASARGYRRSRRDPKSARRPPVDYDAIRTKARAGVRSQLEAWLEARTGIAISAYLIDEIRVTGHRQACAFVKVRTVGDPDGPWRPDVSFWFEEGGAWRVKDPRTFSPRLILAGWGRFPAGILDQPHHEEGAKEILARAARLLYAKRPGKSGRIEFIARCRAPDAERKAVFSVVGRLRQKFHVQRMHLPLREGKCGNIDAQRRLIETLLNDLLGGSILPDPREYHLKRSGPVVLATGFAPSRYLEEVEVTVNEDGRPVSIVRTLAGQSRSISLRYVRNGSRPLVSGWDRHADGAHESCEVRWRQNGSNLFPARVKLVRPEGTYEITFTSW